MSTVEDGKNVTLDFTMQKGMVEWSELTKYQAGTLLPQANGNGKDVLIQQCFNCHAFGKIGAVGRHDRHGWKDEIDVMRQTGVARIKPEVRRRGRDVSRRRLRPGFRHAGIADRIAGLSKGEAGARLLQR